MLKLSVQKTGGGWRWWLVASNGSELAKSQIYKTKASCVKAADRVFNAFRDGKVEMEIWD